MSCSPRSRRKRKVGSRPTLRNRLVAGTLRELASAWRGSIDHKLAIIRQTYAMLNAEAMAVRNEVLEAAIVVLIVVEIVLALALGRR